MSISREHRVALRNEIFVTTGMRVDEDDQLMLCALMQAKIMREAGADVSLRLAQSLATSVQVIEKTIEVKSDEMARRIADQISSSVQERTEAETNRFRAQLARVASGFRERAVAKADLDGEAPRWGIRAIGILAVTILGSAILMASLVSRMSAPDRDMLRFGYQVARALPSMDAKAQKALFNAIRATSQ